MSLRLLVASVALICFQPAFAQAPEASVWQGEWGTFKAQPGAGTTRLYVGRFAEVFGCTAETCHVEFDCRGARDHCGGSGELRITGQATAQVDIKSDPKSAGPVCRVGLQLSGSGSERLLTSHTEGGNCSYFCTGRFAFDGTFPFHTVDRYYGADRAACFAHDSPGRLAICRDEALAAKESAALARTLEPGDTSATQIVSRCDDAHEPAACIRSGLDTELAGSERRQAERMERINQPGDSKEAERKIRAIAGKYRHAFQSGDVQGNTYNAADELELKPQEARTLGFSVHLDFYNGHQCEIEGTATYRSTGFFVYQPKEGGAAGCVFEVIPTATGIQFGDPGGKCRQFSCGARGGFEGKKFLFSERVKP